MNFHLKQLFILFSLCTLIACVGVSEEGYSETRSRGDCIHKPSIRGYTVLDERNLIIDAGGRSYHLVLSQRAWGLNSSWGIAFKSTTSRVCAGFDELIFDGHLDGESIRIASIQELAPEEEEHILIRFGKKEPEIGYTPPTEDIEGGVVEELDPDDSE